MDRRSPLRMPGSTRPGPSAGQAASAWPAPGRRRRRPRCCERRCAPAREGFGRPQRPLRPSPAHPPAPPPPARPSGASAAWQRAGCGPRVDGVGSPPAARPAPPTGRPALVGSARRSWPPTAPPPARSRAAPGKEEVAGEQPLNRLLVEGQRVVVRIGTWPAHVSEGSVVGVHCATPSHGCGRRRRAVRRAGGAHGG